MSPISCCCECVSEKEAALRPPSKDGKPKVRFAVPRLINGTATCQNFNTTRCNMMGETQVMCGIVILLMQLFLVFKLTVDHILPVVLAALSGTAAVTGGGFGLYAANTKLVKHIIFCMLISISSSILALGVLAKTAIDLEMILKEHGDDVVLFEMIDVLMIVMSALEFFAATAHWILCFTALRKNRRKQPREINVFYEPCITNSTLWFVPDPMGNFDTDLLDGMSAGNTSSTVPGRRRHFSSEMTPTGLLIMQDEEIKKADETDSLDASQISMNIEETKLPGSPVVVEIQPKRRDRIVSKDSGYEDSSVPTQSSVDLLENHEDVIWILQETDTESDCAGESSSLSKT